MVMGGDSCPEGRGCESQHHILDGHFSHVFVVKIVCFEKMKINKMRPEWPKLSIIIGCFMSCDKFYPFKAHDLMEEL